MLKTMSSMAGVRSIGISIECDALRMAESRAGRVVRGAEYLYPAGLTVGTEAFAIFLKHSLRLFAPRYRHLPVWVSDCLPGLQIRYLTLPAVASRAVGDMVYWAFRKDLPFVASQTIFDYDVEMQSGASGSASMHVMAYTAPRQEVGALAALLGSVQIRPAGIIIPPFALRNLVRQQGAIGTGAYLCVYAGADATTLLVIKDGRVHSCRLFKTGMNALLGIVADRTPDCTQAEALKRIGAALVMKEPGPFDMQIREVMERILQQIELSLSVYMNEHAGEAVDRLQVMGAIAGIEAFTRLLEERLGVAVQHVSLPAAAFTAADAADPGRSGDALPDRMALAAGAALSRREHMPNLLYTCRDREVLARHTRWSVLTVLLVALLAALLHLAHSVCGHCNLQLQRRLAVEQTRLEAFSPPVDQTMLAGMASKALTDGLLLKRLAAHWLPYAAFRPLADQLLPDIRVSGITFTAASAGGGARAAGNASARGGCKTAVLNIRGVVEGDPALQRSKLASYAMRLEDTPLIAQARTIKSADGMEAADVLAFEIEAELVESPMVKDPSVKEVGP